MIEKRDVIATVLAYIEEHLEDDLSLDTVAGEAGYSKFHLNRMFSDEVGCTIHRYIRQRRLTKAAEQLVSTDLSIADIAYEARYESQQSFTLAFRQLFSYPPQVFRSRRHAAPTQSYMVYLLSSAGNRQFFKEVAA